MFSTHCNGTGHRQHHNPRFNVCAGALPPDPTKAPRLGLKQVANFGLEYSIDATRLGLEDSIV